MEQTQAPRWVPFVPPVQFAVIALYALPLVAARRIPDWVFIDLVIGSPVIFGAAWSLGWLVRRRRGANKPDGGEYMTATLANVLMGFGFVLSVLMWAAILWTGHTTQD